GAAMEVAGATKAPVPARKGARSRKSSWPLRPGKRPGWGPLSFMVAQPLRFPDVAGLRRAVFSLGKTDESWFAHYLSCEQIKRSMNKGERISQFVAELTGGEVDPDDTDVANHPFYRGFFHCWNEQRYYEAHDVLEQLWLKTKSRDA